MLSKLKQLFDTGPASANTEDNQRLARLAATALLLEVSNADHDIDDREIHAILHAAQQSFAIAEDDLQTFFSQAELQQRESTSLYEFTQVINQHFDEPQKYDLICQLWRVAYADGDLERYEEHTIRKVAELIYVSHSDFVKAKLAMAPR